MKYSELKVGQTVVDQYGNEYEVLALDYLKHYVSIKCKRFVCRAKISKDQSLVGASHCVYVINTKYLEEQYGLKNADPQYVTVATLRPKASNVLSKEYIATCIGDILDKADDLERYNGGDNAFNLRQAICKFHDELLAAVKTLEGKPK